MKMVTHLTYMTPGRELFFFFFNTPLFCHQELKALQSKRKASLPKNTGTFVFPERSVIQASSKGILTFQLRYNPGS